MKAKVRNFELDVEPMTKFEYFNQIKKEPFQHPENKKVNGFYCNWNGYKFWIDKEQFNKLYTLIDD